MIYIDTENNNQYLSERVGKCNRLDKCGYHYTPRQYYTDNPHKRDNALVVDRRYDPLLIKLGYEINKSFRSTKT